MARLSVQLRIRNWLGVGSGEGREVEGGEEEEEEEEEEEG